jgi:Flp pilus assembly protein TadD
MRRILVVLLVAVSLGCADPQAIYEEGRSLGNAGQVREAAERFAEAIRLDPNVAEYHCGFGLALAKLRLYDQAALEFQEALRLQPFYPKASRLLTRVQGRIEWRRASYVADEVQALEDLWR